MPFSGIRLVDANVWLALVFSDHVHHQISAAWFERVGEHKAAFCRITQMALLRHLTNEKLMVKYTLSQKEAWKCYDSLCQDQIRKQSVPASGVAITAESRDRSVNLARSYTEAREGVVGQPSGGSAGASPGRVKLWKKRAASLPEAGLLVNCL